MLMSWTPDRIAEVTRLWNQGLSTADIGRLVGVTKNAIVGKAHRLGLPARPSPIKRDASQPRLSVARPAPHPKPAERRAHPSVALVNTNGLACKWPFGHPGDTDFGFCGAPSLEGKPYCPEHYERAYILPKPKQNANAA
jgi:GcrA cell cycle regulator